VELSAFQEGLCSVELFFIYSTIMLAAMASNCRKTGE